MQFLQAVRLQDARVSIHCVLSSEQSGEILSAYPLMALFIESLDSTLQAVTSKQQRVGGMSFAFLIDLSAMVELGIGKWETLLWERFFRVDYL